MYYGQLEGTKWQMGVCSLMQCGHQAISVLGEREGSVGDLVKGSAIKSGPLDLGVVAWSHARRRVWWGGCVVVKVAGRRWMGENWIAKECWSRGDGCKAPW